MKQHIIDDICAKLDELSIPFTLKDNAYIYVNTEFYDVGYGTESKIVLYDLSVFLDESNAAVFMYVKTSEKFISSDGTTGDYTNQSSSLFRKVKSVCSEKDGEISIKTIDLGEVPNTVKNTAFKYGWKFRTALNFNKRTPKPEVAVSAGDAEPITDIDLDVELSEPDIPPVTRPRKTGFGAKLKRFFRR